METTQEIKTYVCTLCQELLEPGNVADSSACDTWCNQSNTSD